MEQLAALAAFAALIGGGVWLQHRLSRGRAWSPLWLAFSMTAAAVCFTAAGVAGYQLSRQARSVAGTAWTGGVIWWEVGAGLVFAAVATVAWRWGLRTLGAGR